MSLTAFKDAARPAALLAVVPGFAIWAIESAPAWAVDVAFWAIAALLAAAVAALALLERGGGE